MPVSIIMPTYNRPDLLERLLRSIAGQTFHDYEVIVVDDNSEDIEGYRRAVDHFQGMMNLVYLRNAKNMGAPFSRNRGIKAAKGEYIALVDDDDEWLPEKLEKQVRLFENSTKRLGIVYTWTDAVDDSGKVVYRYRSTIRGNAIKEILKGCFIPSPSVMVRHDAFETAGSFDEAFPSCQDMDMWTRILACGYECDVVKEVLAIYHKHDRPTIGGGLKARDGYLRYYKKYYPEYIEHGLFDLLHGRVNELSAFYIRRLDMAGMVSVQILKVKIHTLKMAARLGLRRIGVKPC